MSFKYIVCAALLVCLAASVDAPRAQTSAAEVDSTAAAPQSSPPPAQSSKPPLRDRIYYGGSIVFSIGGDVSRFGIFPMVAYKVTPKLSVGTEVGYEHVSYDDFDLSADNYGASLFTRYRVVPALYLHAEYQMINYEIFTSATTSDREWVPFLLLGGGLSKKLGGNSWAYVEVLFDVLQDNNSPYEDWEPVISVGVGVGF